MTRKTHAERIMERCKHFTGVSNDACAVGVRYSDVRDESSRPYRWPCIDSSCLKTCEKRETPTRDEAEAEEREAQAANERINTCFRAIRQKHGKERGLQDSMPCPTGCGGTLRYSISSYNGHVHARCSTDGCAAWMQ